MSQRARLEASRMSTRQLIDRINLRALQLSSYCVTDLKAREVESIGRELYQIAFILRGRDAQQRLDV